MNAEHPRPLLDLVSTGELARALAARSDRGWEPDMPAEERRGWRPSLRPVLKYLPWAMLPLGLLALFGLVVAVRGMADGHGPEGGAGWLRFGLLAVGAAFVVLHTGSMVAKTRPGKLVRAKFQTPTQRVAVPLLDAASLSTLRAGAGAGFGDPGSRARAKAKARRFAGSSSWWVLVVLALLLSAGIVVLMLGLAVFELADGREAGPWLVLPIIAAAFSGLGFWMSLRTALKSRDDLRQRRRLRLFRRVLGYIGRGWGGGHAGGGARTATLTSNAGGVAGTQMAAGMLGLGSVAVFAGDAMRSGPRRLLGVATPGAPKVGGLGLAGFAAASVAIAWAGFGWPIDTDAAPDSGPALVASAETPTPASGGTTPGADEPNGDSDDGETLASDESPTAEPGGDATVAVPSPSPAATFASGGNFTSGGNPPAGPTPAGSGSISGGGGTPPTAVPPTATNTPVTPTVTATPETPTVGPDPFPEPPDEPTTRPSREPREPDPTETPTAKPTFGFGTKPTPTPTTGSSVPKPPTPGGGNNNPGGGFTTQSGGGSGSGVPID